MTIKILLVEDDEFKRIRVLNVISPEFIVTSVGSVRDAVTKIENDNFQFVILDMSLPSHDASPGGGPSTSMLSGGIEIVAEIAYSGDRHEKVIILTQYPEIEVDGQLMRHGDAFKSLLKIYGSFILGVVHYKDDQKDWESILVGHLKR